jgi:hypothetical protein
LADEVVGFGNIAGTAAGFKLIFHFIPSSPDLLLQHKFRLL